jgi:hypothetical protein
MRLFKFFDKYVSLGLKPIAIHRESKCPIENSWNIKWSADRWRPYFNDPLINMGILLGDIIDVEADNEEANDLLERMIDGAQRPRFRSAKSIHNLFVNPDPDLTRLVVNGIEFRGRKHQSVVPPSIHNDGSKYQWLTGSYFPVPEMPEELRKFYFENKKSISKKNKNKEKIKLKFGFIHTQCKTCEKKYTINKTRLILEVRAFRTYGLEWMCRCCRKIDIRNECRKIRRS